MHCLCAIVVLLLASTTPSAGDVVRHIDGDGEVHEYAYDAVGRLVEVTDLEGFVKAFGYDARDNVTTVTDGRGGTTLFGYDPLDRMVLRTDPLGLFIGRAYDARGNLTTLTREDGLVETAAYDGLGRPIEVVTPDYVLLYAYDARGNLVLAADDDSRVLFAYDERNRLVSTTTDGTVGPQPAVTLSYAYDPEDRLTGLVAPWGTAFTFGYDGEGRRTSLLSTSGRESAYAYVDGLLGELRHSQSGAPLTDLAYFHAPDGQLLEIVDSLDPARSETLSYDALDRLIQVAEGIPAGEGGVPIPVEDYAYDEEGNRLASHLSALHVSNDHNQLLEDEDYTYAYDARGNRESRSAKADGAVETYSYDSQNRLVGYASDAGTARYAYDALDRRIAREVDGAVESYVLDPWSPDPVANDVALDFESVGGGTPTLLRRWTFGPRVDEPLEVESYAGTGPGAGAPGTGPGSGTVTSLLASRLGSILLAVNVATGSVAMEAEYDAFGARTYLQGSDQTAPRYGYTGREHDEESGLTYYRARHYDPRTGTFLQRDPIGFAAGDLNTYAYVWNDPYGWTDPSGLNGAAANAQNAKNSAKMGIGTGLAITAATAIVTQSIIELLDIDINAVFNEGADGGQDAGSGVGSGAETHGPRPLTDEERDRLSAAGREPDHGGRTRAGRSAEKHGSRPDSPYPPTSGTPDDINDQGQDMLDDLLGDPGSTIEVDGDGRTTVRGPTGRGGLWWPDGRFRGFLDR
ncbi:RHS repeat-associated protein [Hasllibacter halocynthiae]|uniref:RHS repeat-associated protein n=1 Tax=Hasllibacter halocynthiae TaxID=595589 RepID=A0A2T0WZE0_9RHOB|nr:RHS repeat-associated core domain-containing protein [Hasllibacter halocynthiae]PRY92076.1 RHS repeat-associated protein [Hasllibacter halocynthiae]